MDTDCLSVLEFRTQNVGNQTVNCTSLLGSQAAELLRSYYFPCVFQVHCPGPWRCWWSQLWHMSSAFFKNLFIMWPSPGTWITGILFSATVPYSRAFVTIWDVLQSWRMIVLQMVSILGTIDSWLRIRNIARRPRHPIRQPIMFRTRFCQVWLISPANWTRWWRIEVRLLNDHFRGKDGGPS